MEEIAALGGLRNRALKQAFARVPRESFLPPGPWMIEAADGSCYASEDGDPTRILHGVGVVLDTQRSLHCANPARVGRAIEATAIAPGNTVLHVGAGLGYFSAILAELVGPGGHVIAAEIDPGLAAQATRNLAPWRNVEVVGDALSLDLPGLDVVFASCGMAAIPGGWLRALRPKARLTLPLTGEMRWGLHFSFHRDGDSPWFDARLLGSVFFYPCLGLQEPSQVGVLKPALVDGRGPSVRGLRTDPHPRHEDCWLHGDGWCLTTATHLDG